MVYDYRYKVAILSAERVYLLTPEGHFQRVPEAAEAPPTSSGVVIAGDFQRQRANQTTNQPEQAARLRRAA
jgi:hypothetical protein